VGPGRYDPGGFPVAWWCRAGLSRTEPRDLRRHHVWSWRSGTSVDSHHPCLYFRDKPHRRPWKRNGRRHQELQKSDEGRNTPNHGGEEVMRLKQSLAVLAVVALLGSACKGHQNVTPAPTPKPTQPPVIPDAPRTASTPPVDTRVLELSDYE